MKKCILFGLLLTLFIDVSAQTKSNKRKRAAKTSIAKKNVAKKNTDAVVLTNSSANNALSSPAIRLQISDPTINAMNQKATGADLNFNQPAIPQMPKGTYGFANGKIFLRSTTASSPGTGYGSGAVGTGTSIQSIGTSETSIGVNGKNPYAGPWLWGAKQPGISLPAKAGENKKE